MTLPARRSCPANGAETHATPRRRRSRLRRLAAAAVAAGALTGLAAGNAGAVLIVLEGDSLDVQGTINQDIVYVDGTLRMTGDLTINAQVVYFGPSGDLFSCAAPEPGGNDTCTTGRNLTINATSSIAFATHRFNQSLDLTASTNPGAGGSLRLSAPEIIVSRDVDTRGQGAPSGSVDIAAGGRLETTDIFAAGNFIRLIGNGGVTVAGDLVTTTSNRFGTVTVPSAVAGQQASGGEIQVSSTGGDIQVTGEIAADGRDASGGGSGAGGNGAPVTLNGGDVRTGRIDTTGGTSNDPAGTAFGGIASPISITARGSVHVLGAADASGSTSSAGTPSAGQPITVSAVGAVVMTDVRAQGASGPLGGGGAAGGTVTIAGGSAVLGSIQAQGGNATNPGAGNFGNGGQGGTIRVTAAGPVKLGSLTSADGGDVQSPGSPEAIGGAGGLIEITAGDLVTGLVTADGGFAPQGPGVGGGTIRLLSAANLTLGGVVSSLGSDGTGNVDPARNGGPGGPIALRASGGTLAIGSTVRTSGGSGSQNSTPGQRGGTGGAGGAIEIVAMGIGNVGAIVAEGGDGGDFGDDQGAGGNGGTIRVWSDAPLFDDKKVVSTSGGNGSAGLAGLDGAKVQQTSPSTLALGSDGTLSFTSNSPSAEGYRILRSVNGGPAEVFFEGTATSGIRADGPICVPVTFTAIAFNSAVGWTSAGSQPVSFTAQPSATQACNQAPTVSATKKQLRFALTKLRKARWKLTVPFTSAGLTSKLSFRLVGTKTVKVKKKLKKVPVVLLRGDAATAPGAGAATLPLTLPKAARKAGTYTLFVVTTAPDGTATTTTKLTLEVRG
ncbi:MAG: hypothetical protein R3C15_11470 [Thermoleophilia bacterium]